MPLESRHLKLGPLDNNPYVLTCPVTRQSAVLDVGFEPQQVIELVQREHLDVRWLLSTHAHYDHVAGMLAVQEAVGGVFALHEAELPLLSALSEQGAMFGFPPAEPPEVGHFLVDGERIKVGEQELEAIFTPGHSPGHIAFRHGGTVWCADVIFNGSVGRTDLPGGSFETLVRSIHERIFTLPEDMRLLPGHGPATTVGAERRYNPFVGEAAGLR
jgi:glyoxylase-like metal-dependent hydrolase (beta-lactamase superfamily II)